jgi:pimeloyl-ACP methyl ester carboxylesterase
MAVDLPGYGTNALPTGNVTAVPDHNWSSPVRDIGVEDYADAVSALVQRMSRFGPVTLVGHSFGGLVISAVAEQVPECVSRLVYVAAFVPVVDVPSSAVTLNAFPENSSSRSPDPQVGDPALTGAVRICTSSADNHYMEKIRQAFYGDLEFRDYLKFAQLLQADLPLKAVLDEVCVSAQGWGQIPRSYIRCTKDMAIPIAFQDRMRNEADHRTNPNRFAVVSLESSHSPFASRPRELAGLLMAEAGRA